MNPSKSSNFADKAWQNATEEANKYLHQNASPVLPGVYPPSMMQQGMQAGFQYPLAMPGAAHGPSPYPFQPYGMGGMPSTGYPFAGHGQTHTFANAPDVVTIEAYNLQSEVVGAGMGSLQREVNQIKAHLMVKDGYKPEKQAFDASNLRGVLQLQSSSKKRIADQPAVDDDALEAKIEEIMKTEKGMTERAARMLAMKELTKPTTKKARPAKGAVEFDFELWGDINLKRGQAEVCPELIAKVAAIDKKMVTGRNTLKANAWALIDANKQYWGYAEMMPDPITPADKASLDDFVKLKIAHGFPPALDWDGKIKP